MMKIVGGGALVAAALYFGGVFDGGYVRVVGRSPAEVSTALADLDITTAPGEPGSDSARSGGVKPVIRLERNDGKLIWTVMSGDKVATRMIAHLEPVDDGKQTRVRAEVQRGDAADDYVSPTFRSKGLTLAVFSAALEGELSQLVAVGNGWGSQCEALVDRIQQQGAGSIMARSTEPAGREAGLRGAIGDVAQINLQLNAIDTELRNAGCNPDHPSRTKFRPVNDSMFADDPAHDAHPDVSFEPGKPMVDVRPSR